MNYCLKNAVPALVLVALTVMGGPKAGATSLVSFTPVADCSVGSSGNAPPFASGGCEIQSSGAPVNGITGVEFQSGAANSNMTVTSSGGIFGIYVNDYGGTNGSNFTGVIPVSWDFTLTSSVGANLSWGLSVTFTGANLFGNNVTEGDVNSFNTASGSTISGVEWFNGAVSVDSTITGYEIRFEAGQEHSANGDTVTMYAPLNAIAINGSGVTPEPGSWVLAAAGIAAIAMRRKTVAEARGARALRNAT